MKRFYIVLFSFFIVTQLFAVRAKPGLHKTITLSDGSTVQVTLHGDEHSHYWEAANGARYLYNSTKWAYNVVDSVAQQHSLDRRMAKHAQRAMAKSSSFAATNSLIPTTTMTKFAGKKRGLVILVQFPDMKFSSGDSKSLYGQIANQTGFTNSSGFIGSVKDYFLSQSAGQFEIDFDVIGPVTMPKSYAYYGQNDAYGNDMHPGLMLATACQAVKDSVNFANYDWYGDGSVDMVYVIYAGQGEADGGASNTIWPHEWTLTDSDYGNSLSLNGVTINTYACSNEVDLNHKIEGIGTWCHEFSHCLGLPDMYDVNYGGNYGMGRWDLMDDGNYNGDSFCPAGYTAYEKTFCGWLTPTELSTTNQIVTEMPALSNVNDAYVVYNAANRNEYYLLENRQQVGWDAALPGKGLLITHVDYDANIWANNIVNSNVTNSSTGVTNNHQRCTIFHAGNDAGATLASEATDPYPYLANDSLTNNSIPSAFTYNANSDGTKMMNKGITTITQNADGTISFNFKALPTSIISKKDTLFYESFNKCNGIGGNDNIWSGSGTAGGAFLPDNAGWTAISNATYGANACGKFGNTGTRGIVTTPTIMLTGNDTLTFKAAPWGTSSSNYVYVSVNNTDITTPYFLTPGRWTTITVPLSGTGASTITFTPTSVLFLDEVLVGTHGTMAGIENVEVNVPYAADNRIYSIDGRYLGMDINALPRGIYITNGRKIVKQ